VYVNEVDSATHSRTRGRSKWIEMSSALLRCQRSDALHGRDAGCGNHMGKSSACESSTREIRAVEATQKRSLFVRTRDGRRIVAYDLDSVAVVLMQVMFTNK
jgi:hypothetical protein